MLKLPAYLYANGVQNVTTDQPPARESTDVPWDDNDPDVVSDESDDESELEQMLTAFYAD